MPNELLLGGSIVTAASALGYLALIGTVSLVAAMHKDQGCRDSAHKVLDKLLRRRR